MDKELNTSRYFGFGTAGILITLALLIILVGGGFFGYQYLQLQKMREGAKPPSAEPTTPPPASTETQPQTTETDTSNWKTYRNEEYGFEVRYPPNWELKFQDPQFVDIIVTLTSSEILKQREEGKYFAFNTVNVTISTLDLPSFDKLDEKFANAIQKSGYNFIIDKRRTTLNGYNAYLTTEVGHGSALRIYFEKYGKLYRIVFPLRATLEKLLPAERVILSTFKFIK